MADADGGRVFGEHALNPFVCPYCGGKQFDKTDDSAEETWWFAYYQCGKCDGAWREDYMLKFRQTINEKVSMEVEFK